MISLTINGEARTLDVDPETPLLWVLRDTLGLTGTKYGCGVAMCGACTVHVDGVATRTCVLPVSAVAGKRVTTIEGLAPNPSHPVQKAWAEADVPQCGYCQSGQIMAAAALRATGSLSSEGREGAERADARLFAPCISGSAPPRPRYTSRSA